jgi:serine/threonine-protein kinase
VLELVTRVNFEQPTPLSEYRPDAPPAFEQVLLQALEKDRDRRYANVALFAAALAPFTTPRAGAYAERVAGVLGEQVAPARPTVELGPEPVAVMPLPAGPATATAPAVVRPSLTPPATRRRAGAIPVVVIALFVLGLGAAGLVGWSARGGARAAAGQGSSLPAAEASSARPPPVVPAVATERTAAPEVAQPTPGPTGTAAPSAATVPAPKAVPPSKGTVPRAPSGKTTPAPAEPAPPTKPHKDPYAQ